MGINAITLNALQDTPAAVFGDIARKQYGIPLTLEDKKAFVIDEIGQEICTGMDDDFFEHTYRAMKDYDMGVYDADRWAWLNTLFGYDIGADRASRLITWYDDNGLDVLNLTADDKDSLKNVAEMELGFRFNYRGFATETPDAISYTWPRHRP